MKIEDIHVVADIFDKQIKVYKEACDYVLHTDAEHSKELFLLLLGIGDSLSSLSL